MTLIYQDKLVPGDRQLEFIVTGKNDIKVMDKTKHSLRAKKRQYGLEAYGIPKDNQKML